MARIKTQSRDDDQIGLGFKHILLAQFFILSYGCNKNFIPINDDFEDAKAMPI
jgi:hypothetical protein